MSTSGSVIPGADRLAKVPVLSHAARRRHKWFQYWERHHHNVSLTCRYFGISRQTFYDWKPRYEQQGPRGLEDRSCRPRRVRQRTWSLELIARVKVLREQYPRWGKDKLAVLLHREGRACSVSMVGRILTHLKHTRQLIEPVRQAVKVRKRRQHARRKPKEYTARQPGDIVQVDTLDVRPIPGTILKQFTARDIVSRWDVVEVYSRATATTASHFLGRLLERMPFPVRAIQVDGGSEFMAEFEQACQDRDIQLFVLPPRSPKLNGHVERAQRTHTEEFWEVTEVGWTVRELQPELRAWETVYNTVRPHQSLDYQTPAQFLDGFIWNETKLDQHRQPSSVGEV
jgi:transposase InsO family protein